jgi:hypothetical protein
MKVLQYIFIFTVIIFAHAVNAQTDDIAISSVKVTYQDDQTTPGKVVVRPLKSFQDNTFWSKPDKVNITVEISNNGSKEASFISVTPELYFLLERTEDSKFPPIRTTFSKVKTSELKSIAKGPIWVWNRTLSSSPIPGLTPGQKTILEFKDMDISNPYYATDYQVLALAIRVFAQPRDESADKNYSNNVVDYIVPYGD